VTVKSVLHEIVAELNRPHLHAHIDETEEEYAKRTAVGVDPRDVQLADMQAQIAALQAGNAPAKPAEETPVTPVTTTPEGE